MKQSHCSIVPKITARLVPEITAVHFPKITALYVPVYTLLWNDGFGNLSFENPVKIAENSPPHCNVVIFPNPFVNHLTIEITSNLPEEYSIFIRNIYGQSIKSFCLNNDKSKDINRIIWDGCDDNQNACSPGIYLITIKSNSYQISRKVIKY